MQTFYPVHMELPTVVNNSLGCLREILYVLDWSHSYQRWADCEIFKSESSPDPTNLNPIQSWSVKFLKVMSLIQSWSAHVKLCILFCLMRQKHYWSYFAL